MRGGLTHRPGDRAAHGIANRITEPLAQDGQGFAQVIPVPAQDMACLDQPHKEELFLDSKFPCGGRQAEREVGYGQKAAQL